MGSGPFEFRIVAAWAAWDLLFGIGTFHSYGFEFRISDFFDVFVLMFEILHIAIPTLSLVYIPLGRNHARHVVQP